MAIKIKKENRGKFTAKAKRAGSGVQEYARRVLANKEKYPASTVKQANFARNAAGWNKEFGGKLYPLGGVLATLLPTLIETLPQLFQQEQGEPFQQNKNAFTYRGGSYLKKYKAPSHEHGGQVVDVNANPANTGIGEIELEETALIDPSKKNDPYIFSDVLGTAEESKKIDRKFKGDDQITRNGRKIAMNNLVRKNEMLQSLLPDVNNMRGGGMLKKYQTGDPLSTDPTTDHYSKLLSGDKSAFSMPPAFVRSGPVNSMLNSSPFERKFHSSSKGGLVEMLPETDFTKLPVTGLRKTSATTGMSPGSTDNTSSQSNPVSQGTLGAILKGAAYVGSAIDAFQPYEREKLQLPEYRDTFTQGMGASYAPIRNDINRAASKGLEIARGASRNFGQYFTRSNKALSDAGRNLGQVGLQEKQYRDRVSQYLQSRQDQQAEKIAGERIRTQNATSANRAKRQDLLANFMQNVNNLGTEFQRQDYIKEATADMNKNQKKQFILDLVKTNAASPNFTINGNELKAALDREDYDAAFKAIKFTK